MTQEALLKMKLHESVSIDTCTDILRVYNGWIYYTDVENQDSSWQTLATFVPEVINCETNNHY